MYELNMAPTGMQLEQKNRWLQALPSYLSKPNYMYIWKDFLWHTLIYSGTSLNRSWVNQKIYLIKQGQKCTPVAVNYVFRVNYVFPPISVNYMFPTRSIMCSRSIVCSQPGQLCVPGQLYVPNPFNCVFPNQLRVPNPFNYVFPTVKSNSGSCEEIYLTK